MEKLELIDKMKKQATCVYLACEESIARDLSESLWQAANLLEHQVQTLSLQPDDVLVVTADPGHRPPSHVQKYLEQIKHGFEKVFPEGTKMIVVTPDVKLTQVQINQIADKINNDKNN